MFFISNGSWSAPASGRWSNNVYRCNISEHDARLAVTGPFYQTANLSGVTGCYVYNNTFYNNTRSSVAGRHYVVVVNDTAPCTWANNIFATTPTTGGLNQFLSIGASSSNKWISNAYVALSSGTFTVTDNGTVFNSLSAWQAAAPGGETGATTASPRFLGSPPVGVCTWTPFADVGPQPCPAAHKLQSTSTYIGSGLNLTASPYGLKVGTQDYWGNTIPHLTGTGYNIGAYGATQ